jgi:BlaI family penicillinase repressor
MKGLPRISDAEWLVMQVLWSKPGLTADEVVSTFEGRVAWNPRTIRTLISRLHRKRALVHKMDGRKYRYWPAVNREVCIRQERRSFIHRVYGGTVRPMLAAFIEDARLSPEDIEELKQILDRKGKA